MTAPDEGSPDELHRLRSELAEWRERSRELQERNELLEALFHQSPAAFSLKEAGGQGRYLLVNERWEQAFGRSASDAVGKSDRELWPPETAAELERIDAPVLETGHPAEGVIALPRDNGVRQWLSWRFPVRNSSGTYLGGYSVDVSRFSPGQNTLEHRLVCQANSRLMGVLYGEEDVIIEANDVFLEMLGYTREELTGGRMTLDDISSAPSSHVCRQIRRELETANTFSLKEVEFVRKDGTIVPAGVGGAVLDRSPRMSWIMYVVDMAEQRRVERRERRDEAWERLGLTAAGLAHDFNNLLVVIIGNTSMAASDPSISGKSRAYLEEVLSAAQQAAALVRQVLVYSGKARITPARVRLNEILRELVAAEPVPAGVQVEVEIADNLPAITGDPSQLWEAFRNLVVNAIEAVDRRGAVRITAKLSHLAQPVAYPDTEIAAGDYACVSIQDTGPGIDEKLQSRIFDPFFTTKFQGRGLGLAAAYGIVRRHGGGIHVESRPGEGSRFDVLLPAAPD
ncbi:MAG TPA: ATP-binding protein [Bryobacteraceae bacterium]|nr:ATP-binding protein [Bryobacteraceae bacterium]